MDETWPWYLIVMFWSALALPLLLPALAVALGLTCSAYQYPERFSRRVQRTLLAALTVIFLACVPGVVLMLTTW